MNIKQKITLWIGIVLIVLMGLYPPWLCSHPVGGKMNAGYKLLFKPPVIVKLGGVDDNVPVEKLAYVDFDRLIIQWVIVAVVTGGLIVTFKDKKPKAERKQ